MFLVLAWMVGVFAHLALPAAGLTSFCGAGKMRRHRTTAAIQAATLGCVLIDPPRPAASQAYAEINGALGSSLRLRQQ